MASELENSCGFHASDTAADDVNGLGRSCFLNIMLVPLHCLCINRTACKVETVGKLLIVRYALVMAHIEAAVVAKDTGTDILFLIVHHLGYPCLVCKERTCEACAVKLAFLDRVCGNSRVETSCADNGDINKVLYVLNICKVAVLGHVNRRMCPVPCVICTVIAVKAVVACILKILCSLLGFFHVTADLNIVLAGDSTLTEALCLGDNAVTK